MRDTSAHGAPEHDPSNPQVDCAIVGAGPAGLTAATYLRRFRRTVALLDADESRARWIPTSHNCPGFPSGVSGESLLSRMRAQASDFGAPIIPARIAAVVSTADGFELRSDDDRTWSARCVILASGVVDRLPAMARPDAAIERGILRICAICDGLEATDRDIAVVGPVAGALPHAVFLRTFSRSVCVVPMDGARFDATLQVAAKDAGVELLGAMSGIDADSTGCRIGFADGSERRFDVVYPALGSAPRNELALQLGARVDDSGCLLVDAHQRTSVPGLYAIGDIVSALNQIAVAAGHAAIAATSAHNALPPNRR